MKKESQQKYEIDSMGTWTNIDDSKPKLYRQDNEASINEKERMNRSGKVKDMIVESDQISWKNDNSDDEEKKLPSQQEEGK